MKCKNESRIAESTSRNVWLIHCRLTLCPLFWLWFTTTRLKVNMVQENLYDIGNILCRIFMELYIGGLPLSCCSARKTHMFSCRNGFLRNSWKFLKCTRIWRSGGVQLCVFLWSVHLSDTFHSVVCSYGRYIYQTLFILLCVLLLEMHNVTPKVTAHAFSIFCRSRIRLSAFHRLFWFRQPINAWLCTIQIMITRDTDVWLCMTQMRGFSWSRGTWPWMTHPFKLIAHRWDA